MRQACRADDQAQCASVPPGGSASLAWLQQHAASLSSGWQKYDDGSWNPVQKPANTPQKPATLPQRAPTETTPARPQGQPYTPPAARGTAPSSGARAEPFQRPAQLDQDHPARFGGLQRRQQYGAAREGGFGGGRFHR